MTVDSGDKIDLVESLEVSADAYLKKHVHLLLMSLEEDLHASG
jgi:hypothetical protein